MPVEVILPKVDMDMSSGTIAAWHVAEGEWVEAGDILFEIETDKATMEVESPGSGRLHFLRAKPGDEVPIGQVIAWIFAEGEALVAPEEATAPAPSSAPREARSSEARPSQARLSKAQPEPQTLAQTIAQATEQATEQAGAVEPALDAPSAQPKGVRATPLARRLARQMGLDLAAISGSGPRGRITRVDIERLPRAAPAASSQTLAATVGEKSGAERIAQDLGLGYRSQAVGKMRSVIARRLTLSKTTIPHFHLNADIELDALLAMRAQLNGLPESTEATGSQKISLNDLLIKACAGALQAVPEANVSWDGDRIVLYEDAHISVAVAMDAGLVTPVLRYAQRKGIQQISAEVADLVARAKGGKLSSRDYQGGSFSLSNLGMFGVKSFNAIINPPESMILAVGQGVQQFVPDDEGKPRLARLMSVSLACDHRVVDGALAALWLQKFKALVENPVAMLLH